MTRRQGENLNFSSAEENVLIAARFYNLVAQAYKTRYGKVATRKLKLYKRALKEINPKDHQHKISVMEFYSSAMLDELGGERAIILDPEEGEKQIGYSTLKLNERRGLFLARYMERNKIKTLTTSQAKTVLLTVESGLKNMQVIRALKAASKFLCSEMDKIGPWLENRLKILSPTGNITKSDFFKTSRDNRALWSDPF